MYLGTFDDALVTGGCGSLLGTGLLTGETSVVEDWFGESINGSLDWSPILREITYQISIIGYGRADGMKQWFP